MKHWPAPITGILVFTVSILASLPLRGSVTDPTETDEYCQVMDALDQVSETVTEARQNIDQSSFNIDAQLEKLDYDADSILEFTRHSIAFEPYKGSLRGPRGTLLSRAGNALDQSLLLGKLLNDAGYEARIARTQLDEASAVALLKQMTPSVPRQMPEDQKKALANSLVKLSGGTASNSNILERLNTTPDPKNDPNYGKVLETTERLQKQLKSANIQFESKSGDSDMLLADSSDYFWVQWRDTVDGDWKDAHPAFANDPPATVPEPTAFIEQSVPNDLMHRFRFRLFIERRVGSKLETIPISAPWERPVANLVDLPLTFSIMPNSVTKDTMLEGRDTEALERAAYFIPLFNNATAPGGQYFNLKGNIIDPMAASNPAAGTFATVGDRFGDATGELGGSAPVLTAQWIEITLISPGGEERTWRRTTLDRIGPAARASGEAPDKLDDTKPGDVFDLLRKHTIMIAAGETPQQLVLDQGFARFLDTEPMIRQITEQLAFRAFDELDPPNMTRIKGLPTFWPGHLGLFSLFDRAGALAESHRIYRASPGVVIHVQGPRANGGGFEMVDIVTNARRAVSLEGEVPRLDPAAAVVAGVWDTAQEGVLLQPGESRLNTDIAFEEARKDDKDIVVLPPGKPITGLALPVDTKAAVQADLSRGFAVVLPDGQGDAERAGWWRVNPETGETVGQAADGRGQDTTEYSELQLLGYASTYGFLTIGMVSCGVGLSRCNDSAMSCMSEAVCCGTWNAVGFAIGLGIVSTIGGIAWDIVSFHAPVCGP